MMKTLINWAKINRLVNMIKKLSVEELGELNRKLNREGFPPITYSGVPAKPKPNPPTLSGAATVRRSQ